MSSEEVPVGGPRLHRLFPWFDPESAAVVTILLGLFQVLMSALLVYTDTTLPKIFILPLLLGILIMAGGSLTMANERNPSRSLLQQCASSNVAGLVGALLAFCLYCYSLSVLPKATCPLPPTPSSYHYYRSTYFGCPLELMEAYTWSIIMLLLLYNSGAIFLHGFLSLSAIKTLKAT
ncbi:uncharacterized protein si:dkey-9i23.16 [Takifugu flavidus]|uniref:Uncharacterized protein n=1 Tax=Takifugu flavidus TaxID=433684 RepID=A0A5C6MW58_9TELE|nr:uncharacterized protein si:dkey-9i23.16 [Takifugu flavidus]TWW59402.1 hypothetical protein D4764_06G0009320 [Takifugu flavidus]